MKRLLAMLLAGCMLIQPLPGSAVTALGAEVNEGISLETVGDAAEGEPAGNMTVADAGIIEEVSSGDPAAPAVSGGENSSPDASDGAAAKEEDSQDIMIEEGIGNDLEIISPTGEKEKGGLETVARDGDELDSLVGEFVAAPEDTEIVTLSSGSGADHPSYIEVKLVAGQMFVPKGGLDVAVDYSRIDGTGSFSETAKLEKPGDTKTIEFNVEPGEYKVSVNAGKYAGYEQTIKVGNSQRSKICVSTARSVKANEEEAGSGWLRLGDVEGDGEIDQADVDKIRDRVLNGNTDAFASDAANLNEGLEDVEKVDIADLQIAVQNSKKEKQISSEEVQQIPLPPETEAGTKVEGNLDALVKGGDSKETVQLKPSSDEEISVENPVAISFPLAAEGEEAPKLGGMTIQAPVEPAASEDAGGNDGEKKKSGIESGWVEVESVDEENKPVIYLVAMTDGTDMDKALEAKPAEETEKPESETHEEEESQTSKTIMMEPGEQAAIEPGMEEETSEMSGGTEAETPVSLGEAETPGMSDGTETDEETEVITSSGEEGTEASESTGEDSPESFDSPEPSDGSEMTMPQKMPGETAMPGVEEFSETNAAPGTEQTETTVATEADISLEGDTLSETSETPDTAAGAKENEPIPINMENIVLGTDNINLDITAPGASGTNTEMTESSGMDGTASGEDEVIVIPDEMVPQADTLDAAGKPADIPRRKLEGSSASVASDGSIVMNFGQQVAVKKVTIKITGTTKKEDNLVNISKVEFVNDMAGRIPEPQLSIPELTLTPGNEEILVSWKEQPNVTGYELEISGEVKKAGQQTQTVRVAGTRHTFTGINNNDLRNFKPYQIRARSLNGEWHSDWSKMGTAIPKPDARPEPVDNLKIKAGYRSLSLNWKDMDDASGYMVFYREDSETEFKPAVEGSGSYQPQDNTEAEVNKSGEGRITTNSYTLTGLGDGKLYWVYVIGWNELGWGSYKEDRIVSEKTDTKAQPQLPKYHAINLPETDDESSIGKLTPHIVSASCRQYDANPNNHSEENDKSTKGLRMVGSKLDGCCDVYTDKTVNRQTSALGVVDNDYDSYWQKYDWDEGISYNQQGGIAVKLDQAYDMSYITYSAYNIEKEFARNYMGKVRVLYRDTTTNADAEEKEILAYISRRYDVNNQLYYLIKFQKAVKANEIRICFGSAGGDIWMRVGEIRFHECDDWYDGIMNLFADDMHSSLRSEPEVTEEELARLETGLETPDEHGEKHPLYDSLKLELELARKMFADRGKEQTVLKVDTRLTTASDSHLKFGGLNAWQPLGRVAAQGETIVIYVGHNIKRTGESSNVQVVFTQYHAQSNELNSTVNLKVGRNEIAFPKFTNENRERGGQMYIQYTGTRGSEEQYEVRVLGGQKIPVLNIYKMGPDEKTAAIKEYVKELEEYVKTIQTTHESLLPAKDADGKSIDAAWKSNIDQPYSDRNCLLNATDLMMDYMMYSVPALQVWKGITRDGADLDTAAKNLETSLDAMEDTMKLFYQHKGLTDDPEAVKNEVNGKNEMPVKHLNIRYMQMFAGAFMYASGNHIGVEYPETNVAGGAGSWDSFGWGIAHEIGHDINQSWYAIAEITNNYFAQLLTKAYNGTRFKYEIAPGGEDDPANDIYSKVTSGALGRSANGAVQLGLYWQLHLAFDNYTINNQGMTNNTLNDTTSKVSSYPYTDDRYVFNDYDEQFNNLFFARVDTYGRNPSKAPHGGVTLASGAAAVDQNLMRLSCAAANANILPFFERWGMVPDEGTLAYAKNFGEATTKALYYVNDDARDYRAAHPGEPDNILNKNVIESATVSSDGNKVSITVTPKADAKGEVLLGYEIIRGMYSNGKIKKDVVGFKLADGSNPVTYIDEIATINNRVMYYEVKAVDQYLNYSNVADAGSVKIQTNGALPKSEWTIETTMKSDEDVALNPSPSFGTMPEPYVDNGKDDPDGGFDSNLQTVKNNAKKVEHSIDKIADRNENSAYIGTEGTNASITIDLHDFCEVTSLIYRGDDLGAVTVSVSTDNTNWTQVKNVDMTDKNLVSKNTDGSTTIWFDAISDDEEVKAAWIGTYEARYVKLAFSKAGAVKINEIDICGPTGDNLEFKRAAEEGSEAEQVALGVLKGDYMYSKGEDDIEGTEDDGIIPAGSLVFTGSYKGNPAYNVVILYDAEGNVIGAHTKDDGTVEVDSQQIIFATVPAHGELGETSDGTWVYYLEPTVWKDEATWKATVGGNKIRGELYRVDNALTNDGERIVSDTQFFTLPDKLPEITMTGGGLAASAE